MVSPGLTVRGVLNWKPERLVEGAETARSCQVLPSVL